MWRVLRGCIAKKKKVFEPQYEEFELVVKLSPPERLRDQETEEEWAFGLGLGCPLGGLHFLQG